MQIAHVYIMAFCIALLWDISDDNTDLVKLALRAIISLIACFSVYFALGFTP